MVGMCGDVCGSPTRQLICDFQRRSPSAVENLDRPQFLNRGQAQTPFIKDSISASTVSGAASMSPMTSRRWTGAAHAP